MLTWLNEYNQSCYKKPVDFHQKTELLPKKKRMYKQNKWKYKASEKRTYNSDKNIKINNKISKCVRSKKPARNMA